MCWSHAPPCVDTARVCTRTRLTEHEFEVNQELSRFVNRGNGGTRDRYDEWLEPFYLPANPSERFYPRHSFGTAALCYVYDSTQKRSAQAQRRIEADARCAKQNLFSLPTHSHARARTDRGTRVPYASSKRPTLVPHVHGPLLVSVVGRRTQAMAERPIVALFEGVNINTLPCSYSL